MREKKEIEDIYIIWYTIMYNTCARRYLVGSPIYLFASVRSPSMVIRICVESTKFSFSIIKFIYFDTVFTKKINLILESMMNRLQWTNFRVKRILGKWKLGGKTSRANKFWAERTYIHASQVEDTLYCVCISV